MKFAYLIEPPFNFRSDDGEVTGCDVELARSILADVDAGGFEPVETEFAQLLPGLAAGKWRMTTGLFATAERRRVASFSRPIWALSDGLLVRKHNPKCLAGYLSIAGDNSVRLAVIRDQFQHRSAVDFGVPDHRISIFESYAQAAEAVINGAVDAYASVGRAHTGFVEQHPQAELDLVIVPREEKPPAFGSFAFAREDNQLRCAVDDALAVFLGSDKHRAMMARFGFSEGEVDLVANWTE
ncbi:amino acid ABC transporter substrate-binding protein (PAAT family) [Aminobacter aminovorans]|uniref:Ectoine/hydroxyectoine ABC transporter solute-binding protein EhuB n=1 Tax=Aminobacter aminovorans TaxID=83263 RepID=A0A380WRJ8_AMIAI|nr:transporter substrate-binding domain-containing protein [Aminobacter aminovorans]TCS23621.1 amino acid ABC transporter substrate-binding protein (PAAT family) [Aminobacter aminovorans]SUU91587.1 ectoine/hydroxyectoine ABC transporter solute-binding protein EhuB [Aminobacter aminovorans]